VSRSARGLASRALAVRTPEGDGDVAAELGAMVLRAAVEIAWSARHPHERFAARTDSAPPDRVYYRASDGWESPLWHYPARPGTSGEPLLLAHGLGLSHQSLDFRAGQSLARAAWRRGYDVFLLGHRGDRQAVRPAHAGPYDFDDLVDHDVPAAVARVRELTGARRVLWIGHAMGGQLVYGHLARGGGHEIAAAVTLCAPVCFQVPESTARIAALAAHLLPPDWQLPIRALQRALVPLDQPPVWRGLAADASGPELRGVMLDGVEDLHTGVVRQVARWVASGQLCDRDDRFDYLAALRGVRVPTLVVACAGDDICPPSSARPAADTLPPEYGSWLQLGGDWGHLDPLVGRRAPQELFPRLLDFLDQRRSGCW